MYRSMLLLTAVLLACALELSPAQWAVRDPASLLSDSVHLSSGRITATRSLLYKSFNLTLEWTTSCEVMEGGFAIILANCDLAEGQWFGVNPKFDGIAVTFNSALAEVNLYTNEGEGGLKAVSRCPYKETGSEFRVQMQRREKEVAVMLGERGTMCGSLPLDLEATYVAVAGDSEKCPIVISRFELDTDPLLSALSSLSLEISRVSHTLHSDPSTSVDSLVASLNTQMDDSQREIRRLKDSFSIQLKRNEWMINSLSRELDDKHKMIEFELRDLTRRVDKGELAERIGRWVDIYSRRTLTTEPELTQTLRDIREWSEKVDSHVTKDDKFTWIYVLLVGLLGAAVLLYRQAKVVARRAKKR